MLWPAKITVHLHDTIETKDLSKEDVPALRHRVREIISAPVEEALKAQSRHAGRSLEVQVRGGNL